jgi:MSHA biogenesis protein MshJ
MKLPPYVEKAAARFDRMTMRERSLITGAIFVAVLMIWILSFMDPIAARRTTLTNEMAEIQAAIESGVSPDALPDDPDSIARAKEKKLKAQLEQVNAKLAATSAGLIPPERMVQVIRDVLKEQHNITLVSLHNKPVTTLIEPAPVNKETANGEAGEPAIVEVDAATGPYMHPVELVLEGRYLDVLEYLKALEALPWRLYWKVLELRTTEYPTNRVRIELGTLSMDKEWLGV